jgi:DNA-binding LacI/PurR family transcriptional regulator
MKSQSTQKRIAEKVGVSTATVSRTLNDQPGVSDDVRERILKAANELEYSPNVPARSLVTSVMQTVAFVVYETNHKASEDPFYPVIMAGAQAFLAEHNYHILLTTLDDRTMERPQTFSVVSQNRVDGLILAGPEISTPFILAMQLANIPVVLVDNCLFQTPINCVVSDDEGSAYQVTRHLLEHAIPASPSSPAHRGGPATASGRAGTSWPYARPASSRGSSMAAVPRSRPGRP